MNKIRAPKKLALSVAKILRLATHRHAGPLGVRRFRGVFEDRGLPLGGGRNRGAAVRYGEFAGFCLQPRFTVRLGRC